jgi:dihydrofolate reductase
MLEDRGPMVLVAEALLLGRVTYEGFTGAWPSWDDEAGYADEMNGMPKYVASTTLRELEWSNSTLLEGDVADVVARLKLGDGGDILVTVQTLMEHDLVDEYRLMVFPVILGSGRRIFPDDATDKTVLKLVDSKVFDSGVAVYTYHPARDE